MREHDVEHTVLAVSPELDYVVLRRQGVTEMHRMADGVVPDRLGTPVMSCSHDHVAEYLWHLDALFVCEGSGDLVWYNRAEDWNATHLYMGPGPIYIYGKPECLLIERRCVTTGERVSCHIMQKVPPPNFWELWNVPALSWLEDAVCANPIATSGPIARGLGCAAGAFSSRFRRLNICIAERPEDIVVTCSLGVHEMWSISLGPIDTHIGSQCTHRTPMWLDDFTLAVQWREMHWILRC